jgi:O-antigen ligase
MPAALAGLRLFFALAFVVALMLGGGGPSLWREASAQLASLPLLGFALWTLLTKPWPEGGRVAVLLLIAVLAVPLVQLVPLPPDVWTSLPGRSFVAKSYVETGVATPWLPISLNPRVTWHSVLTIVAASAVFLGTMLLDRRARRYAAVVLIAFGFVNVVFGLAQVARGDANALGLFANRNHFAALLYCALAFAGAWAVGSIADRRPQLIVSLALCLFVFVSCLIGIGVSRSRAGLLISALVLVACLGLAGTIKREEGPRRARIVVAIATSVGALLTAQFALLRILPRLEESVSENARWEFASVTFRAALQYLPFGTGIGTFREIYPLHQTIDLVTARLVNHAANDFVEAWLEGGFLMLVVLLAFLAWFLSTSIRVWRESGRGSMSALDGAIARAASIVILALLIHSALDFPLRSTTLNVVFAFACGLLLPALGPGEQRRRKSRRVSTGWVPGIEAEAPLK